MYEICRDELGDMLYMLPEDCDSSAPPPPLPVHTHTVPPISILWATSASRAPTRSILAQRPAPKRHRHNSMTPPHPTPWRHPLRGTPDADNGRRKQPSIANFFVSVPSRSESA